MKIFYQILVFIFFGISLFIAREDVVSVIDSVSSYINKDNEIPANINSEMPSVVLKENEEIQLPSKKADMPGALRVVGNLLLNVDVKLSNDKIIQLTNKARTENGDLLGLEENQMLDLSAEKKLQDMFTKQYFEHISPSGIGVGDLAKEVGYEYILIGENLAMGNFKDNQALIDAWMASEGHRANILNEHYTEIGVALGKGNFEGENVWMAVQHFGTPRSVCPPVDEVLLGIINLNQEKIKEMESDLLIRKEMIDKEVVYEGSTQREQVKEYNSLIIPYNNFIKEIKNQIDIYNTQIRTFNSCLQENQ